MLQTKQNSYLPTNETLKDTYTVKDDWSQSRVAFVSKLLENQISVSDFKYRQVELWEV
jgi:hypothetical protein